MNNDWLDIAILEDYLDGKLDAKTMNRVEREALEDPFVAEALAGLSMSPKRSLESLSLLQKQLHERVAEHHSAKKATVITWQRLSVAAAAAVIFISVGIIFWMKQVNYQEMASKKPKKIDVIIAPKTSSDSVIEKTDAVATLKTEGADKTSKEIDKAIKASKINSYAVRSKVKSAAPADVPPSLSLNEVTVSASPAVFKNLAASQSASTSRHLDSMNVIRGRVTEERTGMPLQNAIIRVEGTELITNTNQFGEFVINADSSVKNHIVTASYIGFANKNIAALTGKPLKIEMAKGDKNALNEVVIRGYTKQNRKVNIDSSFILTGKEVQNVPVANVEQLLQGKVAGLNIQGSASPIGGWTAFKEYLSKESRFKGELKKDVSVELEFDVKRSKPVNIRIIRGREEKYNKEAIRLLKDGPKWNSHESGKSKISVVIDF